MSWSSSRNGGPSGRRPTTPASAAGHTPLVDRTPAAAGIADARRRLSIGRGRLNFLSHPGGNMEIRRKNARRRPDRPPLHTEAAPVATRVAIGADIGDRTVSEEDTITHKLNAYGRPRVPLLRLQNRYSPFDSGRRLHIPRTNRPVSARREAGRVESAQQPHEDRQRMRVNRSRPATAQIPHPVFFCARPRSSSPSYARSGANSERVRRNSPEVTR